MGAISRLVLFLCVCTNAFSAESSTDFGANLARIGQSTSESKLSTLNASEELGVTAEGAESGGGRRVDVKYSQILKGQIDCPVEVGEGGRRVGIQQFVTQCQTQSGSSRRIWVCVPDDANDTVDSDCTAGTWHSVVTTQSSGWKNVLSGVSVKLSECSGEECALELRKSSEFSGGEAEAQSKGDAARNTASGASAIVRDHGAMLPDGTVLAPGSNPNSGVYAGELVAAGGIGACADDVKASITNGTPVFTCDGQKEVDTFTGGGGSCRDVETCLNTEEEELLSSKTCQVSLSYSGAQCQSITPTKQCTLVNVYNEVRCNVTKTMDVRSRLVYSAPSGSSCNSIGPTSYQALQSNFNAKIQYHKDLLHSKVNSMGGYPVTMSIAGGSPINVSSYNSIPMNQACMTTTLPPPHLMVYCHKVTICKSSPGTCESGYVKDSGSCLQNVELEGYGYLGEKSVSISGKPNSKYQYFGKSNTINGCSTYEQ